MRVRRPTRAREALECTPYHKGDVFLTAHAAFNMEFEQALQAIDPTIASPFWVRLALSAARHRALALVVDPHDPQHPRGHPQRLLPSQVPRQLLHATFLGRHMQLPL